jgi:hypothetical protein
LEIRAAARHAVALKLQEGSGKMGGATFKLHYGRAREKRLAVDYLTNFQFILVLDIIVLMTGARVRFEEAFWFREANGILTQIRQVPVGSRCKGIKVKGNEPLTFEEYYFWVLGGLNLLVESAISDINAGDLGDGGPDRVPRGLMWGITGLVGSIIREGLALVMDTPAPARLDIRPLIVRHRSGYRRLVRIRERRLLKRSAADGSRTPYMIW